MDAMQGSLGKLACQCYAVFCLRVILVSLAIAHCIYDVEAMDSQERTKSSRHIRALHGPALQSGKFN